MPETSGTLRASTSAKNFIFYRDPGGGKGSQKLKDIWIPAYVDTKCLPTTAYCTVPRGPQPQIEVRSATQKPPISCCVMLTVRPNSGQPGRSALSFR